MTPKKHKTRDQVDPYLDRFNDLGLEFPETVAANPRSMKNIATFLLKHKVFDSDEKALLPLLNENESKSSE